VEYYRNSLLYLACVDVEEDKSPQERLSRAHDLTISALLGDTIYNFGELVEHKVQETCTVLIVFVQLMHPFSTHWTTYRMNGSRSCSSLSTRALLANLRPLQISSPRSSVIPPFYKFYRPRLHARLFDLNI
jgi:26S proteasome regulatory subunit N9